jgi:putative sigma-54 modulation protein
MKTEKAISTAMRVTSRGRVSKEPPMRTKFAGRQVSISEKLKTISESGMERISRVLGEDCSASIVLNAEKSRQIAEVTIVFRQQTLVGQAEGFDLEQALQAALEKAEKQALRYRTRLRTRKREAKAEKQATPLARPRKTRPLVKPDDAPEPEATPKDGKRVRTVPVVVHSFPSAKPVVEPHIVRSQEGVALRPMTLEEAVKEAEFRDHPVFVFRNLEGIVHVLYRKRDGKMALIEAP